MRADEVGAMRALSVAAFGPRAVTEAFIRQRFFGTMPAEVVVAESDGELIGSQAITYLPFVVNGKPETGAMFTEGVTHPNHRKRGVFRALLDEAERQAFERGACLLFTMPNDESFPAFERSPAWRVLPDREFRAAVLDLGGFLEDRGMPAALARSVGACHSFWRGHATDGGEEIPVLTDVGSDLDGLAQRLPTTAAVICRRDAAFLDWRFTRNPVWTYRYFVSRDAGGHVDAYLVTTTEQRMGTTLSHMVDAAAGEYPGALPALIRFAGSVLRSDGTRLFGAIFTSPVLRETLRHAGFRAVPQFISKRRFHTVCMPDPARPDMADVCMRGDAWYLTLADFDTI